MGGRASEADEVSSMSEKAAVFMDITYLRNRLNYFLIFVFVDNVFLHKWWRCHRLGKRSFFVSGRQFHVCARCTGIFIGYMVSPFFIPWGNIALYLFPISVICMGLDGITQLFSWRTSNNLLRLVTGLSFGFTFLPFFIYILGGIIVGYSI